MNQAEKQKYIPPEAELISFVPREAISTADGEMTEENAFSFFSSDSTTGASLSFEITDPDLDLD